MSFDSIGFLTCFLPVLALLHTLLRSVRARNVLLLAAGLISLAVFMIQKPREEKGGEQQ